MLGQKIVRLSSLLTSAMLLSYILGYAQPYWFRHYRNKDGLSHNHVNCSIQDKKGFIWFGTLDGLNRFDGYNFKVFRTGDNQSRLIGNNFVSALYQDKNGTLWIGTHNGLWKYDASTEGFTRLNFTFTKWIFDITDDNDGNLWFICLGQLIKYDPASDTHVVFEIENCLSIMSTVDGDIWVGTSTGQIARYDHITNSLTRYDVFEKSRPAATRKINRLLYTPDHTVLIGTQDQGLKVFDTKTSTYQDLLPYAKNGATITVTDIVQPAKNEYWVSTTSGIYMYNAHTGEIRHIQRDENDANSLSDNYIQDLNIDKDGGIWISSRYEGISYFHEDNNLFTYNFPSRSEQNQQVIVQIIPDEQGHLWVATENNGLYVLDRTTNTMERRHTAYGNVSSILVNGNELWIGKGSDGLDVVDIRTGKRLPKYDNLFKHVPIKSGMHFNCLYKTSKSLIVGTTEGVLIYDEAIGGLRLVDGMPIIVTSAIFEDHRGGIWVGSYYSGLFYIDPETMVGTSMDFDFSDDGRYNNTVTSITEDAQHNLWFSTEGRGISKYDRKSRKLTFVTTDEGLPSNNTFKILKGKDNTLWISTAAGLAKLDLKTKAIRSFTESNGLPFDQFNYNVGYATPDGTLYFGATRGLVSFNENNVKDRDTQTTLYITGIQVENQELLIDSGAVSLKKSIIDTDEVVLPYDKSSISLDIAALSYQSPQLTQYSYIMEGLDDTWTDIKTNRKIYFSKLPPGTYVFKVRAAVSNGRWDNERALSIVITPPWWRSTWAYIVYAGLVGLGIYLISYYYHQKIKEKNARMIDILNNQKDKEIYEAKIDFFTNVAHEIRTPLSLIVAPIEKIEQAKTMDEVQSNLTLLQKNADRLVSLTNQLLDFRKIEQKNLKLNFVKTSINDLLLDTFQQFKLVAESKGLKYQLVADVDKIYASVDPEALRKVLSNLIHNATKYARTKILIALTRDDDDAFSVKVANDAPPIPEDIKDKLFEPFYRLTNQNNTEGTGIGLAIAHSLTELHNGSLTVGSGTELIEFVLTLPMNQEIEFDFDRPAENSTAYIEAKADDREKKASILIVDDSEDMLRFLYNELCVDYQVYTAANGLSALELLNETSIGLIVSDVMMPGMDGFELCRKIKTDVNLSHIPVILLTAKNTISAKIEGLELGADAYIEKPFSPIHVKAQIDSLLQNRERIIRRFATSTAADIGSIAISKTDDVFLNKLNDVILENLDNVDLDVDFLAAALFMSRRNLYRKIKAVSGVSPLEMITIIRLKKAAELLLGTDLKIYEIAMQTGFKSPDTFTRNFIKQFGKSPTEFAKKPAT